MSLASYWYHEGKSKCFRLLSHRRERGQIQPILSEKQGSNAVKTRDRIRECVIEGEHGIIGGRRLMIQLLEDWQ
jgi:hypothetical protein